MADCPGSLPIRIRQLQANKMRTQYFFLQNTSNTTTTFFGAETKAITKSSVWRNQEISIKTKLSDTKEIEIYK